MFWKGNFLFPHKAEQTEGEGDATISMFYGNLIRMFFRDTEKHHVPHIHAIIRESAVYSILDGTVLDGELPPNKTQAGCSVDRNHHEDLIADWNLA